MSRYIDAYEYEKRIKPYDTEDKMDKALYNFAHNILICCSSADVKPIVYGEWIIDKHNRVAQCSVCNKVSPYDYGDFCKWCGATMRAEKTAEEVGESDKQITETSMHHLSCAMCDNEKCVRGTKECEFEKWKKTQEREERTTNEEAIKMLKSKLDGHTDTSWEWTETVRMAINALSAEKTWIPVSERLPNFNDIVLASTDSIYDELKVVLTIYKAEKHWFNGTVKAWMPLPEQYKEEK